MENNQENPIYITMKKLEEACKQGRISANDYDMWIRVFDKELKDTEPRNRPPRRNTYKRVGKENKHKK